MRLQHAPVVPQAVYFYDEFEDVVSVAESTIAYHHKGFALGSNPVPDRQFECKAGELFWGRAKGFYDHGDNDLNFEMPMEDANWIRLENHNLDKGAVSSIYGIDQLWFKAKDVSVTYRESELAGYIKQHRESALD
jgi:hypothetical protein